MNETAIAYCGLVCDFCYPNGGCSCKADNHCGKRLSEDGCYQYRSGILGDYDLETEDEVLALLRQGTGGTVFHV